MNLFKIKFYITYYIKPYVLAKIIVLQLNYL